MDKDKVIDYVMTTPHNPNRAVLEGMLEGDGCDCGFSCTETEGVLTEETVTTVAGGYGTPLSYSQFIDADTIKVIFDGVEYACKNVIGDSRSYYGAPYDDSTSSYDWSECPFYIASSQEYGSYFGTENEGTYSIKIIAPVESVEISECFANAVRKVGNSGTKKFIVEFTKNSGEWSANCTFSEILQAYKDGLIIEGQYRAYDTISVLSLASLTHNTETNEGAIQFTQSYTTYNSGIVFNLYVINSDSTVTFTSVTK